VEEWAEFRMANVITSQRQPFCVTSTVTGVQKQEITNMQRMESLQNFMRSTMPEVR
jgi:hypothetical protein